MPELDIFLDGGNGIFEKAMVALEHVLPHLRRGGVYIVEDIVGENHDFLHSSFDYLRGPHLLDAEIRSMTYYPYMLIIEKVA